jgi:glutathione peroxidase
MEVNKLLVSALVLMGAKQASAAENLPSFFSLKAKSIDGQEVDFADYKGKVIMVVNVASRCGFTSQYKDLEAIYRKFKDKGLVVLGFPSNDFGAQEPGSDQEIKKFCSVNYGVSFPIFSKAPVTGDQIQPVYKYLTQDAGATMGGPVLWNFEKFLIDRQGRPVERFRSQSSPSSAKVQSAVEKLL